jgi:hypothetical protein
MSSFPYSTVTVAAAAVMGAVMLGSPSTPAFAQSIAPTASHESRSLRDSETIDQRIAKLHAELKITAAEEPNWQAVAQTMRENAATMQKLAAERSQQGGTAIESLESYTKFAEAHVDGLKKLTASFQTLYEAMPDQQKKIADQVFQRARG